jgi:hypothetical protein
MAVKKAVRVIVPAVLISGLIFSSPYIKSWLASANKTIHSEVSPCDLAVANCIVRLGENSGVDIRLSQNNTAQTLTISVANDNDLEKLTVVIEGRDMFMGIMTRPVPKINEKLYQVSDLLVPACTIDPTMIWLYKIQFEFSDVIYERVFEVNNAFHAQTPLQPHTK